MKKTIALILSLVMLVSIAAPAASAVDGKCDCGITPIIYVGPLGNTDIYEDYGTENQKTLFRPDTKSIINIVIGLLPGLFKLAFLDFDGFGDALIETIGEAMGGMALDGNGNSKENVSVVIEMPEEQEHSKDSQYYFHYDWRLDPVEVAGQLDEFDKHRKQTVRYFNQQKNGCAHKHPACCDNGICRHPYSGAPEGYV